MAAALASAWVDIEVALVQLVLCTLITLWMVRFVEIRDACVTATSQAMSQPSPTRLQGLQDEPMDVDPTPSGPPRVPTALSSSSLQEPLPFLGEIVNGVRQVVYCSLYVPHPSPCLVSLTRRPPAHAHAHVPPTPTPTPTPTPCLSSYR